MLSVKIPRITVLVQSFDVNGVMRFPSDPEGYFGLTRTVDPGIAVFKQAQIIAAKALGNLSAAEQIEPILAIEPTLKASGLEPSLLYLMKAIGPGFQVDSSWLRIVDVLRRLPPGPVRVAYNKAMQVFAGAMEEVVNVLEVDAEVQHRLDKLISDFERPRLK